MADNRAIGVFDSGLGGLTVLKELITLLPNENFVYFGDTGRVPYGTRSEETILKYAAQDEAFLCTKNVKIIIAACGTVSSLSLKENRKHKTPFFEMITPAVDCALKLTQNKKVGILGTAATIKSEAHKKMLLNKDNSLNILGVPCSLFVPLVENDFTQSQDPVVKGIVERYLKPIKETGCDTVVLGCTHYPVLKEVIGQYLGSEVKLINPGEELSKQVKSFLESNNMLTSNINKGTIEYFVSDHPASFKKQAMTLLGKEAEGTCIKIDIE